MSWKGFSKAIARLPQVISAKAGYSDKTEDDEFNLYEQSFLTLEALAKKLNQEATTFKDSVSLMLHHQASFGETLVDVYGPLDTNAAHGEKVAAEDTPSNSFKCAEAYWLEMTRIRDVLLPELDVMEVHIVAPSRELLELISSVKKVITKRSHKLIDYDRYRDSVKKLKDNTNRDYKDEKKLGQLEASLAQATTEYNHYNDLLKRELPLLLQMRLNFVDPLFKTLYRQELKVYQLLSTCFNDLVCSHFDGKFNAKDVYLRKEVEMMEKIASLTLNKRPLSSTTDGAVISPKPISTQPTASVSNSSTSIASPMGSFNQLHQKSNPNFILTSNEPPPSSYSNSNKIPRNDFVIALYDFDGEAPGDLKFKRDDRIEVLERTESKNDWWKGRVNGKVGQFPGTYIVEEQ